MTGRPVKAKAEERPYVREHEVTGDFGGEFEQVVGGESHIAVV